MIIAPRVAGPGDARVAWGVRVVGIDYGERRIGLAITDPTGTLARPLRVVHGAGQKLIEELVASIASLAAEDEGVSLIVIGLPAHLDGRPHDLAARVREVAGVLEERVRLPIAFQDERLTSHEADTRLRERHRDWRARKALLDAAAAAVLLQDYVDEHRANGAGG